MYKQLAQDLEVPVMSKLVSLLICQSPVYLFEDFYNQDRLPSLKHLTLQIDVEAWKLSTYLSLWKRHDGVTSLVLTLDRIWWMRDTFSERIAHLFPSMKKLELTIILPRAEITQEINRLLEPFKIWDLKEVDVLAKSVVASSSIVAVLRNMSMWKGIYTLLNNSETNRHPWRYFYFLVRRFVTNGKLVENSCSKRTWLFFKF